MFSEKQLKYFEKQIKENKCVSEKQREMFEKAIAGKVIENVEVVSSLDDEPDVKVIENVEVGTLSKDDERLEIKKAKKRVYMKEYMKKKRAEAKNKVSV